MFIRFLFRFLTQKNVNYTSFQVLYVFYVIMSCELCIKPFSVYVEYFPSLVQSSVIL